ncbi:MAG: hypothetical protein ACYDEJ_06320 [Desulfitobacteriaceae bacterium]
MRKILDAHIHLDKYQKEEVEIILQDAEGVITVSCDLESCKTNLKLAAEESRLNGKSGYSIDEVSKMMKAAVREVLDGQRR